MEYNSNNIYNVNIPIYIYIYFSFELYVYQTNLEKKYHSTKILGSTTAFNMDDNENWFLSRKSAY